MSESGEPEKPKFTKRNTHSEPEEQQKWRTAFVVVMDEQGQVLIDNNPGAFAHIVDHVSTQQEAIWMLGAALEEFKSDKIRALVFEAVKVELIKAARSAPIKAG